jgi:hypothetical protein
MTIRPLFREKLVMISPVIVRIQGVVFRLKFRPQAIAPRYLQKALELPVSIKEGELLGLLPAGESQTFRK